MNLLVDWQPFDRVLAARPWQGRIKCDVVSCKFRQSSLTVTEADPHFTLRHGDKSALHYAEAVQAQSVAP